MMRAHVGLRTVQGLGLALMIAVSASAQPPQGELAIQTEQLSVLMSSEAGWTIRTLHYEGTPMFVPAGGQGAVFSLPGSKWFGSAMEGGEQPILLDVSVDGKTVASELPQSVTGETVTVKKASLIDKMAHVAETTFEGDLFVQKHYFLALEDIQVTNFYAFIYSVTPDTDAWLAQPLEGEQIEGVFSISKAQLVNRDVAWAAQYDTETQKGLLCYYVTPFKGPGSATRIWDTENYHKHFSQPLTGMIAAGTELSYTMVMKLFSSEEGQWKEAAAHEAATLKQRFPTEERFVEKPRIYDEGVPEEGHITAQTANYKIVFSAKQAWTIYNFTFGDHLIGHSNGFYGTVLIPVGSNFIGTGHTEGGREIVHAVKLLVDGNEEPIEIGKTFEGSTVQLIKDSTIHKFRATTTVTVTDDEVTQRTQLRATEVFDLKLMYLFMHCWQGTTTQWIAELPDAELIEGEFDNQGNEVLKDTRWIAQYEPNMGIAIVGYTPKVASGNGSHTMIWDLERYHKFYTRRVGAVERFEEGDELDYTMVVKGIAGETGDWAATLQAVEQLKEEYPPIVD